MVPSVVFDGARFEDAALFRNISVTDAPVTFRGTTFAAANFDNAVFEKGVAGLSSASTADRISAQAATSAGRPLDLKVSPEISDGDDLAGETEEPGAQNTQDQRSRRGRGRRQR